MESREQVSSDKGVPGRPPPPHYSSAPPPYYDPQNMHLMAPLPGAPAPVGPFYPPPPAYQEAYQAGYPPPAPPEAPPAYPGGHSMYPDVSQLPQPEAGNVFFTGASYPDAALRQRGLHDGQPCPSTHPYGRNQHGAPRPNTGHHQYGFSVSDALGLEASRAGRAGVNCHAGYKCGPMYGYEAPHTLPSSPSERLPPYNENCTFQTSTSTGHSSQANPSACPPAFYGRTPASSSSGVPLGFTTCTGPLTPVRPAPQLPGQSPWAQNSADPSSARPGQHPSSVPLKDGQPPPGCVVSWRGGEGLQVFFLQSEGHIVSPKKSLVMSVYKRIGGTPCEGDENLIGMIEVHGCWRLKLTTKINYALHSSENTYIFLDDSTCPKRIVVLQLPTSVSKTMQVDLLALINELTDLCEDQESIVNKITTGVGTVYTDLTKKLNTVVKETVPGAHKSTKWLRKGTGSIVRMGGSAVSKGIHVIAEHIPANEQPKEESPVHTELLTALRHFKKSKEEGSITYVDI